MPTNSLNRKNPKTQRTQSGSGTHPPITNNKNNNNKSDNKQRKRVFLKGQKTCHKNLFKKKGSVTIVDHVRQSLPDFTRRGTSPLMSVAVTIMLSVIAGALILSSSSRNENNQRADKVNRLEESIGDSDYASKCPKDQCISSSSLEPDNRLMMKNDIGITDNNGSMDGMKTKINEECSLFLAKSTLMNTGLGLFTTVDVPSHTLLGYPDIIIFLSDPNPTTAHGLKLMFFDYSWDGQIFGGQYEGMRVYAIAPGLGMLANGHEKSANIVDSKPDNDDAGLSRDSNNSPGKGAISYHHNLSFLSTKQLIAGQELLLNYGSEWFQERRAKRRLLNVDEESNNFNRNDVMKNLDGNKLSFHRPLPWLRENGLCMDNIKAGASTISDAGRGAFATRFLSKGSIVAPAPVIQISSSESLSFVRIKSSDVPGQDDILVKGKHLLLNYCFGHRESSLLLFPYSAIVNFINHANSTKANAKLQWSTSSQHRGRDWPKTLSLDELKALEHTGLMLEFAATRDILPNEEILIDYGSSWEQAWEKHILSWNDSLENFKNTGAKNHLSSQVMNKNIRGEIRTELEQSQNPYPPNIFTSCYYKYSNREHDSSVVQWKKTPELISLKYLRPCSIIKREKSSIDQGSLYTVLIRNRYGLTQEERIPKNVRHIVTHVPRYAIQFSDKLYTTDQHLTNVFRHFIEIPDSIFPDQWKHKN